MITVIDTIGYNGNAIPSKTRMILICGLCIFSYKLN